MSTSEERDQLAWNIIDSQSQAPFESAGLANSDRPRSFPELEIHSQEPSSDFGTALSSFLHEFYSHRDPRFFIEPPTQHLEPINRVALAGTAEYLSNRFGFTPPEWVNSPEYTLPEEHYWLEFYFPKALLDRHREVHIAESSPEFLRRKLIFSVRGLIAI